MDITHLYQPFTLAEEIQLSEENLHHVLHVLRMRNGNEIMITNGSGQRVHARLAEVTKRQATLLILNESHVEKPNRHLHIAIAFTKNTSRMEWFLEKATEIGIEEITPLITTRSERVFFKRERFEKILQSALLQSKQYYIPVLHELSAFDKMMMTPIENKCIAHCNQENPTALIQAVKKNKPLLLFIGPEGDFTEEEIKLAEYHQVKSVSLGDNRLRTETAGVYGAVVYATSC